MTSLPYTHTELDELLAAKDQYGNRKMTNPEYREAHKQLAFALLGTGDRAGAKSELEAYVALAPDAADSAQMKALIEGLQ